MPQNLLSYFMVLLLRFYVSVVLPSIVITSLGGKGASRRAGCLLVCPCIVFSRFSSFPLVARRGLRSLIVASPWRYMHCFLTCISVFLARNLYYCFA